MNRLTLIDPLVLGIENENITDWLFVLLLDKTPPRHVGLS